MKKVVLNYLIIAAFAVLAVFTSCSSPESNGKKVAKKYCDCQRVYVEVEQKKLEITQKEYSKFVKEINSYKFQNRVDVRNKVQEIENNIQQMHHEADKAYSECLQKSEEYYRKISEKYATNKKKKEQFDYAGSNYNCPEVKNDKKEPLYSEISNLRKQVENLRLSIIPSIPDTARIKRDLIGRDISGEPFGKSDVYADNTFLRGWRISERMLKNFQILKENRRGDEYMVEGRLTLQPNVDGGEYETLVNLTYVLRHNDDWTITSFGNRELNIIKTGKYDKCVTITLQTCRNVKFTNNCNATLVIVGEVFGEGQIPFGRDWKRFIYEVSANATEIVTGSTSIRGKGGIPYYCVHNYRIHYIERP